MCGAELLVVSADGRGRLGAQHPGIPALPQYVVRSGKLEMHVS